MKKLFFGFSILILLSSCNLNKKFEKHTVEKLYVELKKEKNFESDLNETMLFEFLKNVNIAELKKGKKIEQDYFFESFKCDCQDKLSISYSNENNKFELNIYEESFEKDLDWCPETTYLFSFQIESTEIKNVMLEQIAG